MIDLLRPFLPKLQAARVVLAIENHDRFKCQTLVEILKALDSPYVGICLDTVNSYGVLEGTDVVVEALGPYTVNLHLKDFVVKRVPSKLGWTVEGTPAGEGMLDIPGLIRRLKGHGREFNAILELWIPPEENIAKTLKKEEEWIARSIAAMRQVPELVF